jgi:hypothetical protein
LISWLPGMHQQGISQHTSERRAPISAEFDFEQFPCVGLS